MRRRATGGSGSGGRPLGVAVVRGDSMRPTLGPGDRLLVRYGARVGPRRIVVARFADGAVVVKRVEGRRAGGWWLVADNSAVGVDSRHRGVVPDEDVWAVALARLWPRPRPLDGGGAAAAVGGAALVTVLIRTARGRRPAMWKD